MASNFVEYLKTLDDSFEKTLSDINKYQKKIMPKHGLLIIEPSITQTSSIQIKINNYYDLENISAELFEGLLRNDQTVLLAIKAATYSNAQTRNQLAQYLWSKNYAISDGIISLSKSLEDGHLLSALTILRAMFEQVADAVTIEQSLIGVVSESLTLSENSNQIAKFSDILHKHTLATRIDWEHYLDNPIKGVKKKAYSSRESIANAEADSILNSVDALDKLIKGARRGYEFLCEFAHPNVGTYFVYRSSKKEVKKSSPFMFIETISSNQIPSDTIDWLKKPIFETFELFCEALNLYIQLANEIDKKCRLLDKKNKEIVFQALQNYKSDWNRKEPCPCLSGLIVGLCCGKSLIK